MLEIDALELISSGTNDVVGFLSCVPGASQYRVGDRPTTVFG